MQQRHLTLSSYSDTFLFTERVLCFVYIPPSAHAETACDLLQATVTRLQAKYPDSLIFYMILNHASSFSNFLPTFKQFIDCPIRENKTLDLLYSNVKDAYKCCSLPPLKFSDHRLVHLSSTYTPVVKRMLVTTRTVKCWSHESIESLHGCLDFCEPYGDDIDGLTDCITEYIKFCTDIYISSRVILCCSNNKPWVTRSLKAVKSEGKDLQD